MDCECVLASPACPVPSSAVIRHQSWRLTATSKGSVAAGCSGAAENRDKQLPDQGPTYNACTRACLMMTAAPCAAGRPQLDWQLGGPSSFSRIARMVRNRCGTQPGTSTACMGAAPASILVRQHYQMSVTSQKMQESAVRCPVRKRGSHHASA